MSLSANLHIHSNRGEKLKTESRIQDLDLSAHGRSAYLELRVGADAVTIFFDNIEDIERLAFESSTLATAARDAWITSQESTEEETTV